MGSEEPEHPPTPSDDPGEGFETAPQIESDDPPPSEGFPTEQDVRGAEPRSVRAETPEQPPGESGDDDASEGFETGIETADDSPADEGFETGRDIKAPREGALEDLAVEGFGVERQS